MKKIILLTITLILLSTAAFASDDVLGLWKTIDDETGQKKSIIVIYMSNEMLHGRIIATFDDEENLKDNINNPTVLADKIPGEPYLCGLDIVWNMKDNGKLWTLGKIMDPKKPKIYDCDIAYDAKKDQLMVKGKIGVFGRKQHWQHASLNDLPDTFVMPDSTDWIPSIPLL